MRFWIPFLSTLFAAAYIVKFDPTPVGYMAGLLTSLTGIDVAAHLCE